MTAPRATVRLQFHSGFPLDAALARLDYFAALGVSHVYASPLLTSRAGSMHGYDVVDCNAIDPEVGGEDALRRLVAGLRERGMGLILDIVPNHMGVGSENGWWMDVLRWGRESAYARHFDIDWRAPDPLVRGKLLLPNLGAPYAEVLAAGDLRLQFDADAGALGLRLYESVLPLSPASHAQALTDAGGHPAVDAFGRFTGRRMEAAAFAAAQRALAGAVAAEPDLRAALERAVAAHDPGDEAGRARLHALVERQHYRLVHWKLASDLVNYRRFFDINDLAGLRIERNPVFEDTHATIFRLYAEGLIDGVRCDHVDGLADPRGYCRKLRRRLSSLEKQRPADAPKGPAYVLVEKILGEGESLRTDWETDGTTGYEFMDQAAAVLHDARGEPALDALWRSVSDGGDFGTQARNARRQILVDSFVAELGRTARALFDAARADLATRDVSLAALHRVLVEILVHFPVYRTYIGVLGRDAVDEAVFARALAGARERVRIEDQALLERVADWLGGEPLRALPPGPVRHARERALRMFQQATSPVAAKAVEDTAGYRYGRLLSRNEVGAEPQHIGLAVEAFHAACAARAETVPDNLLATATHDHKRGEDLRLRIAALSEIAGDWTSQVRQWRARNDVLRIDTPERRAPAPQDELMLYQMLVGAWPLDLRVDDANGRDALADRLAGWQRKALREGKRRSRWTSPDEPYEDGCEAFLRRLLDGSQPEFLASLDAFVARIAPAAALSSLAQVVLRLTTPGVPDLYQGTEFWDFSMVDPDNRRPVDFDARERALAEAADDSELLSRWRDGRIKQRLVARLLDLRRRAPALFARGGYRPLAVAGAQAGHVIAFARERGDARVVVVVPRHPLALAEAAGVHLERPALPQGLWGDTHVVLPGGARTWRTLEGGTLQSDGRLALQATPPIAVLAALA
ncbi:malto-oligosyltrehalose synthase [Coralloluteibacterium stylophorae]|uniref:Malto-oligosyltrehalose synthase n=1 Tax=Coralloluteibacterium stylophorae TaxID=1776034 RepID=A0A8J7VQ52_9GAMM|nr:malto-oligosyltrehalose synthase [Coralloluteibacterium stylophorae]MBS7457333.1 malto-oligosyltrehalose synthase [Coralloluteibacterium stylophorae]